jgi:glutathione S-transferase
VTPIEKMQAAVPLFKMQTCLQLDRLANLLSDGRSFLLGEQPGLADIAVAHPLWMAAKNSGRRSAAAFDPYPSVRAWVDRVDAIGQGTRTPMTGEEALAIAKAATPEAPRASEEIEGAPKLGSRISVQTEDRTPEPVVGEVVYVGRNEIAIRRSAPEVGDVVVHAPRAGFMFRPA